MRAAEVGFGCNTRNCSQVGPKSACSHSNSWSTYLAHSTALKRTEAFSSCVLDCTLTNHNKSPQQAIVHRHPQQFLHQAPPVGRDNEEKSLYKFWAAVSPVMHIGVSQTRPFTHLWHLNTCIGVFVVTQALAIFTLYMMRRALCNTWLKIPVKKNPVATGRTQLTI